MEESVRCRLELIFPVILHAHVDTSHKVPRPQSQVLKDKEFVYPLTLTYMDEINARNRLGASVFSLYMRGSKIKEIDTEILAVVDSQVKALVDEGKTFILTS